MPIQITNNNFTDEFGNVTPQYKSNAGDEIVAKFTLRSAIRITSVNNPFSLDPTLNIVTSPTVSWIQEGFRVGDIVYVRRLTGGGSIISAWFTEVVFVNDQICDFTAMPSFYDITNNEILEFRVVQTTTGGGIDFRPREDFEVLVNNSLNGQSGTANSLIDGELSRFIMNGISTMSVLDTIVATPVGNQSGQFIKSVSITRIANTTDFWFQYNLEIVFCNSGAYDQSWFSTGSCLKFYMKLLAASIANDQYPKTELIYDQSGNTGWFAQAHNTSPFDSQLIQGILELDYCVPSTHEVIVDGPIGDIGIGALYISTNDSYYKNRIQSQVPITMIVPTSDVSGLPLLVSPVNEFGSGYTIQINSVNVLGSQTSINFTFTPNAQFNDFMSGVDDGDRLFYIWVKCGNINHPVFADQLKCDPPIGGPLDMIDDYGFLDHSENVETASGIKTGFEANTEDDIAYFGTFRLLKSAIYDRFNVKVEAVNTVTGEDFTLQETNFGFDGVQISNDGRYLLNESLNVNTLLQSNSVKSNAKLLLAPTYDTPTEYGVSIYYPFLLNWKYWLPQANASVDFYPTQNKNWEQYDNLADWQLRIELTLVKDGLGFTHSNVFVDKDYDSSPYLTNQIQLVVDETDQNVGVITEGLLMRVFGIHILNTGIWDQSTAWGMITVEPTESSPRWICSTVLPFDNNSNNPLTPLDSVLMNITYPLPNVAVMECFFDPNKINLTNGCKFTSKIKGCLDVSPVITGKITTDGDLKVTTSDDFKILA